MRRRRGRGQRTELVGSSEVWRHSRCPLCLVFGALGQSAAQRAPCPFAVQPLLVSPGETSCGASIQACFTAEDTDILRGGQSEKCPSPQRLTSGYHGRRADQSGKRLCAAPWSKVKVWSNVLNTGARNSQFRIPVHPLSVLPHFCCEAVPDLTEISRSDLGLRRCSWDQSQISIWPLCLAHRYNNPPLSSRINYWSQIAFSFFLFTQRALYNYYYSFILFSILLLASGLLLSQSLSDQEGGCLQLSAERDYFN